MFINLLYIKVYSKTYKDVNDVNNNHKRMGNIKIINKQKQIQNIKQMLKMIQRRQQNDYMKNKQITH